MAPLDLPYKVQKLGKSIYPTNAMSYQVTHNNISAFQSYSGVFIYGNFDDPLIGTSKKLSNGGDLNANAIPDGYELDHFGALGVSSLGADPDNDGLDDQVELKLGMNASAAFEAGISTNWEIYLPN